MLILERNILDLLRYTSLFVISRFNLLHSGIHFKIHIPVHVFILPSAVCEGSAHSFLGSYISSCDNTYQVVML